MAGASVECTGTYTLTAEDIDNLSRATFVTISAKDQYGYELGASKDDTVTLKQVNENEQPLRDGTDFRLTFGTECSVSFAFLVKYPEPWHTPSML